MKGVFILSTLFCVLSYGCKLPDQPALSNKEVEFFRKLETTFNAAVQREVSPDYLEGYSKEPSYLLQITASECSLLLSSDLGERAKNIATTLYGSVLENVPNYIEITIVFQCRTGVNQYRFKSMDFKTEDLRKSKIAINISLLDTA